MVGGGSRLAAAGVFFFCMVGSGRMWMNGEIPEAVHLRRAFKEGRLRGLVANYSILV